MSTSIKQCKQCGRLIQSYLEICSACSEERDKAFLLIKDYIFDHPNAIITEISEETNVEEKIILHFLKEGRLSVKSNECGLTCEKCGKSVLSGRFCTTCKSKLEDSLNSVMPVGLSTKESKERVSADGYAKMHFDYRKK